jgi:CRISPR system Cascade subunit CasC
MDKNISIVTLNPQNHSCFVRGEDGIVKQAPFGGKNRILVPPQSLNYAFRKSDIWQNFVSNNGVSTRTRCVIDIILKGIIEDGSHSLDDDEYILLAEAMANAVNGSTKEKDGKKKKTRANAAFTNVLTYGSEDLRVIRLHLNEFLDAYFAAKESGDAPKDIVEDLKKALPETLRKALAGVPKNKLPLDIGLFGRMQGGTPLPHLDGAANSIFSYSTHEAHPIFDFFVATDDLSKEVGTGMMGSSSYASGTFVRSMRIDRELLYSNTGMTSEEDSRFCDMVGTLAKVMTQVNPGGKQKSAASHEMAGFTFVAMSDTPMNLAATFENPIKANGNGYMEPSIRRFLSYYKKLKETQDIDAVEACISMHDLDDVEFPNRLSNISEFSDWLKSARG